MFVDIDDICLDKNWMYPFISIFTYTMRVIYTNIDISDTFIQFGFGFQSNNGNYYCVIYCLLLILIDQGWVCLIWKISLNEN